MLQVYLGVVEVTGRGGFRGALDLTSARSLGKWKETKCAGKMLPETLLCMLILDCLSFFGICHFPIEISPVFELSSV